MSDVVRTGDRVQLHYATYSLNNSMIETSRERVPLEFVVGHREVIAGVDQAVLGMRLGERKRVPVMPEAAFGERDTRWQRTSPRSGLPDRTVEGDQLLASIAGVDIDVWVRNLQGEDAVLDANHPLAGETLVYELEITGINAA